jgi:hypothetical protein
MSLARQVFGLAAIGALIAGAILAQRGADDARAMADGELLYLPNEKLLSHFTGGMDSIVADMLWLRCVQYTGEQLRGEHSFTWLQHMLETTVRLDPYFTDAYRYGGMFLASLRADSDAGLDLLRRGVVMRPDAWELPYEMGMIYLLNRPEDPDAQRRAAACFAMAAARPGAPGFVREVAGALGEDYDIAELERQMWAHMLESEDQLLRDLAQRKLVLSELREFARAATGVAQAYLRETGRTPRNLEELVDAGGLNALPADPLGGEFFVGPDVTVYSTSVLDEQVQRRRAILQRQIEGYHAEYGAWPASLETLVESTALTTLPPHPYPERAWQYDPGTGRVE